MSTTLAVIAALLSALIGIAAILAVAWSRTQSSIEKSDAAVRDGLGENNDAITWARHKASSNDYGMGAAGDAGGDGGGD